MEQATHALAVKNAAAALDDAIKQARLAGLAIRLDYASAREGDENLPGEWATRGHYNSERPHVAVRCLAEV